MEESSSYCRSLQGFKRRRRNSQFHTVRSDVGSFASLGYGLCDRLAGFNDRVRDMSYTRHIPVATQAEGARTSNSKSEIRGFFASLRMTRKTNNSKGSDKSRSLRDDKQKDRQKG